MSCVHGSTIPTFSPCVEQLVTTMAFKHLQLKLGAATQQTCPLGVSPPVKILPWNLVWNGPETEPRRTAVSAFSPREVPVELIHGQRTAHDSTGELLERGHHRSKQKTAQRPTKTRKSMRRKVLRPRNQSAHPKSTQSGKTDQGPLDLID